MKVSSVKVYVFPSKRLRVFIFGAEVGVIQLLSWVPGIGSRHRRFERDSPCPEGIHPRRVSQVLSPVGARKARPMDAGRTTGEPENFKTAAEFVLADNLPGLRDSFRGSLEEKDEVISPFRVCKPRTHFSFCHRRAEPRGFTLPDWVGRTSWPICWKSAPTLFAPIPPEPRPRPSTGPRERVTLGRVRTSSTRWVWKHLATYVFLCLPMSS